MIFKWIGPLPANIFMKNYNITFHATKDRKYSLLTVIDLRNWQKGMKIEPALWDAAIVQCLVEWNFGGHWSFCSTSSLETKNNWGLDVDHTSPLNTQDDHSPLTRQVNMRPAVSWLALALTELLCPVLFTIIIN